MIHRKAQSQATKNNWSEIIALTEKAGLQLQREGLQFAFIRLEVMLKIADSAFE